MSERLLNYINGAWQPSAAGESLKILNPASANSRAMGKTCCLSASFTLMKTFPDSGKAGWADICALA